MKNSFAGYKIKDFEFEGRPAKLICPDKPIGKLALKMEYWGAFPDVELSLVDRGYHLAFLKNNSRIFSVEDCEIKARFVKFLSKKYSLSEKCVPIGMSLGGAQAVLFAARYPKLISCLFIDAPVINYASLASFKVGRDAPLWKNEFLGTFPGTKHYQVAASPDNPLNSIETLVKNNIPIVLSYGLEDTTVKYEENGAFLSEAYGDSKLIEIIPVSYRGHHPHGTLDNNTPIVDFIVGRGL